VAFDFRYDTGFGAAGSGTGSNFSLVVARTPLYSSPHFTEFSYDDNRTNYSAPVSVSTTAPAAIPTGAVSALELLFDCNDRNLQLLLPMSFTVTCTGGSCVGPPPPPPPPRQYCPAPVAGSGESRPAAFSAIEEGAGSEEALLAAPAPLEEPSNLTDVANCLLTDGTMAPCGPGNQMCPPGPFGAASPQYHVRDASCGINDPNGPVFDPVHGVYHLHYQNHVGCRGGRTYGHAVSRDFVHWAHMPVSIWNDRSYDEHAIYTGSATVVDGKVVQIYPGLLH
jgi:hypothetical protein